MKLKFTLLPALGVLVLFSATGCNLFRKSKKPKENPNIAADVETNFRQRWMDRRVAELTGQGIEPTAAREQATIEFREKYPHLVEKVK